MTSLISYPSTSNAFSNHRPSRNAHVDFLTPSNLGKRRDKQGDGGPRVVRLSLKAQAPERPVNDDLGILLDSIAPLLAGQRTVQSYHTLSSICHRLVLPPHTMGGNIQQRVQEELEKSVAGLTREWRAGIMSREGGWIPKLTQGWADWEKRVGLLSAVLVYLDRVCAIGREGQSNIRELAIRAFRRGVWDNELLFGKTRDDFLEWAATERQTSIANDERRPAISSLTALSKLLGQEKSLCEPYTEQTESHYAQEAASNFASIEAATMSATRYIEWVLQKALEEKERAKTCLLDHMAGLVENIVRKEAGEKMGDKVVKRALDEAMVTADIPATIQLYRFSVLCSCFPVFVQSLQNHIEDRLGKLISDPANDSTMIEGTLTLKRFADQAIGSLSRMTDSADAPAVEEKEEMNSNILTRRRQIELDDAVRVGFRAGMGSRQNAPAEWIAKHLDGAMRRGQGTGTEAEFNDLLDEIIALIGFTKDKDVFKAFYSTQLAKRLLLNKSASDDMERNMIIKLQREMGDEFTSGDTMMKDLTLSDTLIKAYQSAQAKDLNSPKDASNLSANVLTESAWPAYPLLKDGWSFKLTPDLQSSIDQFTAWYAVQHKNRQLSWRWQLATVTLSGRFASGKYEIGVSLFQAVVMMQFNEEDVLDFKEIKDRTGIESSELVRTLQSLALGRKGTRVLLKKPSGKEVHPTDTFTFNKSFTSDRIKFRINQIQQDLSAEESKKTNEQVAIDRVSVLEATIVRIMKGRKKMTLQLLIDAVVTDVNKRFPPDVKEIKKRMESLIEREFLMRDENDRNLLHYLA